MLTKYLDDLESRIDEKVETELCRQWRAWASGQYKGDYFLPGRPQKNPPHLEWPAVNINQALNDFDLMALKELGVCSNFLRDGGGLLMMVRSNYGTPIIPMLFGVKLFVMEEKLDTLPGSHPLPGDSSKIRKLLERGLPALDQPYTEKIFAMGRRFQELRKDYPKISRYIPVYHPDFQGPLDICEMIWGSELFTSFYDEPELVQAFLTLITDTYIALMKKWEQLFPPADPDFSPHWHILHRGRIMLRDDSAMNLSGSMYEEFVRPHDQRLLAEFGGGGMHSCGKVDHYIDLIGTLNGLYAYNFSQPHYNDVEKIFQNTIDKGINLFGINTKTIQDYQAKGRPLRGLVHCW